MNAILTLLADYWLLSLLLCFAVIWFCLRGMEQIEEQALIAQDMHALIERDGRVQVDLSERQIHYLRRWGFLVEPLEEAGNSLWLSEVTL